MGQITLSDIFIGNFNMYQGFGDKPEIYSSRYPIRGHNGNDFDCPSLTMILSGASGKVLEVGTGESFDSGGYGNFVKILHDGFFTLYAHLNDVVVKSGDGVVSGQLIGHSNNSGNSDFAHLHFGIAPCDAQGNKLDRDNGYGGYIDPQSENIIYTVKNLTEPVVPQAEIVPPILVDPRDYAVKSQALIDIQAIISFAQNNGYTPDLHLSTGENINSWVADILCTLQLERAHDNRVRSDNLVLTPEELEETDPLLELARKHPLAKIRSNIVSFIWE